MVKGEAGNDEEHACQQHEGKGNGDHGADDVLRSTGRDDANRAESDGQDEDGDQRRGDFQRGGPGGRGELVHPITIPGAAFALIRAMELTGLIWFLVVGLIAGWLAGKFMRGGGYGLVGDMIIGVIGALLGGWLFGLLGIGAGGLIGSIIVAFIGAVILIAILRALRRL